jgi:hypothetical protein
MRTFIGRLVQQNGSLVPKTVKDRTNHNRFRAGIPEGAEVEIFMDIVDPKTNGQLAKIKAMTRDLAQFTGNTFLEMEKDIKNSAGLCVNGTCRSFADCSVDEVGLAIQAAKEIGEFVGCYVD